MALTITKPTIGGSEDTWGATINDALDDIVDVVNGAGGGPAIADVTATAAELSILDGATVTTSELNFMDGVTSNVQTQIDEMKDGTTDFTEVSLGDWTISQSGTDLKFSYNGTARFKLSSAGALTVENNVTGFGSA